LVCEINAKNLKKNMQPSWNVYEPSWKTSTERLIFSAFVFYFVFFGILGVSQSELVLHPTSDVTELVRCYDETLTTLLDKFVPLQKVRSTARPSAPWFDADCRRLKTKTRKLEKSYRKKPSNESRLAWLVGAVRRPTRAVPEQTSTLLGVCH